MHQGNPNVASLDTHQPMALQLTEYGGEEESSWVLLEPVALAAAAGQ